MSRSYYMNIASGAVQSLEDWEAEEELEREFYEGTWSVQEAIENGDLIAVMPGVDEDDQLCWVEWKANDIGY